MQLILKRWENFTSDFPSKKPQEIKEENEETHLVYPSECR